MGSRPTAPRFLLLRQKKPGKEKTTPAAGLSARTRCSLAALRSNRLSEIRVFVLACATLARARVGRGCGGGAADFYGFDSCWRACRELQGRS